MAFASGSILSDLALHLLPENFSGNHESQIKNGIYTLLAFLIFLVIEKITESNSNTRALGTLNLIANFFDNSVHGITVVRFFYNLNEKNIMYILNLIINFRSLHFMPQQL